LLQFLLDTSRKKGFFCFYLHDQARLESFYSSYGFKTVGRDFGFSDYDYVEVYLDEGKSLYSPFSYVGNQPMLLNRPENNSLTPGPLEKSTTTYKEALTVNI
jgi:hypothetical protein